ncbi:hypothetical protein D3C76_1446870 [compost metagenome]
MLATLQVALGAQQLTFFEVVEQVFAFAFVVAFQQLQGGVDVASSQLLVGFLKLAVVAAKHGAAGQLQGGKNYHNG